MKMLRRVIGEHIRLEVNEGHELGIDTRWMALST
jgi:hypothetical protein